VEKVRPAEANLLAREVVFLIQSLYRYVIRNLIVLMKSWPKGRKFLQNGPRTKKIAPPLESILPNFFFSVFFFFGVKLGYFTINIFFLYVTKLQAYQRKTEKFFVSEEKKFGRIDPRGWSKSLTHSMICTLSILPMASKSFPTFIRISSWEKRSLKAFTSSSWNNKPERFRSRNVFSRTFVKFAVWPKWCLISYNKKFLAAEFNGRVRDPADQRSQTRGPREGPIRPARGSNAAREHISRKMEILKEILGQLVYFLKNIGY